MAVRVWWPPGTIAKGQIVLAKWWNENINNDLQTLNDNASDTDTALAAVNTDVVAAEANRPSLLPATAHRGKAATVGAQGALEWRRPYELITLGAYGAYRSSTSVSFYEAWWDSTKTQRNSGRIFRLVGTTTYGEWVIPIPVRVPAGSQIKCRVHYLTYVTGSRSVTGQIFTAMMPDAADPAYASAFTFANEATDAWWPGHVSENVFTLPTLQASRLMGIRAQITAIGGTSGSAYLGIARIQLLLPVNLI